MRHLIRQKSHTSQIWLLFWGTLLSSLGQGLIWPFLTIYLREHLDMPLSAITPLFTLQSIAGLAATTILSPLMDRFGRKWAMVGGLVASGGALLAMSRASTIGEWVILLPVYGMVNTTFRIGSYAMVADLVTSDQRAGVYALLRMGDNVGIAAGPAVGGFLVGVAYTLSYYLAATTQFVLAVFATRAIKESLPHDEPATGDLTIAPPRTTMGYGPLLHDRGFLSIWGLYILVQTANALVFVLLGLYMKENFAIPESRYGFVVGINAVMVVLFQYGITRSAERYAPLLVMATGALFYALGMGAFALSRSFPAFLVGMVIFTLGELVLVPTATALVANIAPPTMRARYMGVFSLSFRIGSGIGPVVGGLLSDRIAPVATWYGGMVFCVAALVGFVKLYRQQTLRRTPERPLSTSSQL